MQNLKSRSASPAVGGRVLASVVAGVILATGCNQQKATQAGSLVVASYGGAWQDAQRASMFQPFAKANNVRVQDVPYDGQYAKLKEMVSASHVEWDVVDVEGNMVLLGAKEGLLQPLDYAVIPRDSLIAGATHPYGAGVVAWSWVLAYRKGAISDSALSHPWQSFFDVKHIRGPRGMRNDPRRTLEIALSADGVPPTALYPLDVDRAFKVLDRFRNEMRAAKYPIVWWDEYAKPPQLLQDSEVVLTPAANGRVADAQKQGAPIDFTWKNGILDFDWWVVPKGAPHKDEAMRFIAFASSASAQADIVQRIPYGPVNKNALNSLPAATVATLPTAPQNFEQETTFNTEWWAS